MYSKRAKMTEPLHIHINTLERQFGDLLHSFHDHIRLALVEEETAKSSRAVKTNIYGGCDACGIAYRSGYTNRSGVTSLRAPAPVREETIRPSSPEENTNPTPQEEALACMEARVKTLEANHAEALACLEAHKKALEENYAVVIKHMDARLKKVVDSGTVCYSGMRGSAYPGAYVNMINTPINDSKSIRSA